MARVMMALGAFRFSVSTAAYQSLTRSTAYRWPSQDRIARHPALQFVGPGEETVDLDGTVYPQYRGGLAQVDAMRAEAETGTPLILIDGRGRFWGRYAITAIQETQTVFFDDGAPRKIDFRLSLARYGRDGAAGSEAVVPAAAGNRDAGRGV